MLTSLRDDIAETLEALAFCGPVETGHSTARRYRLIHGAETLRWCDRFEGDDTESRLVELEGEVDVLKDQLDQIRKLADRFIGKELTASGFCSAVLAVVG